MEINKKDRTELKEYFRATKKPTEKQFAEFIDASLNQADDGIVKLPGAPLSVSAEGEPVGTQEAVHFYQDFGQEIPSWSFNLNPRVNPEDPNSNQNGFNIKDATGKSSLFIKSGQGNVGIGTIEPSAPLTIKGNLASGLPDKPIKIAADCIEFGGQETSQDVDSAKLAVDGESFKLYGKADNTGGNRKLDVIAEGGMNVDGSVDVQESVNVLGSVNIQGNIQAKNVLLDEHIATSTNLGGDSSSDQSLPSQKAVKEYVDTRLPKGLISMWSGDVAPAGWAICDGENGTPNLSGQFIVGFNANHADYNEIGKKGGATEVTLTKDQMPSHNHTGNTNVDGVHKHTIKHILSVDEDGTGRKSMLLDGENQGTWVFDTEVDGAHKHAFTTNNTGGNKPQENRPPYYVLAYIMKL
ncbi:MAG: hypothetical protein AAFQ94_00250 [Bacteroidota bacterium]